MKPTNVINFMINRLLNRVFFLLFVFVLLQSETFAQAGIQQADINNEMKFLNYLVSSGQNHEALHLLDGYENSPLFAEKYDSLLFLRGKIFYNQKELDKSISAFNKISSNFPYSNPVKILTSYELAQQGFPDKSILILNNLHPKDSLTDELIKLQKASVFLLNNNIDDFKVYHHHQDTSFNELFDAQMKINSLALKIENHKQKSPFVAGLMSSVIPGSGKIYASKLGEGVSTFLGMSVLGAIVYENYRKAGPKNYKTITFGSLFTVLYVGNIFGSVYSIKVYRDEIDKSIKHAILFNMHVPIRTVFPNIFE